MTDDFSQRQTRKRARATRLRLVALAALTHVCGCAPACVPEASPPEVENCPATAADFIRAMPLASTRAAPEAPFEGSVDGPRSLPELEALLALTRDVLVPELDGVAIRLTPEANPTVFFAARVDVETIGAAERDRSYAIAYNPDVFANPPPAGAVVAILTHELRHVLDYTEMHGVAFATFGASYAAGDVATYERRVDQWVLDVGCHTGLADYRRWLYSFLDADAIADKRRVYMTPEEIARDAAQ